MQLDLIGRGREHRAALQSFIRQNFQFINGAAQGIHEKHAIEWTVENMLSRFVGQLDKRGWPAARRYHEQPDLIALGSIRVILLLFLAKHFLHLFWPAPPFRSRPLSEPVRFCSEGRSHDMKGLNLFR